MQKLLDLSHVLEPGMPAYPGLPVPQFKTVRTHAESVASQKQPGDATFQIAAYEIGGNTGTYIDAPFHRYPQGQDFAALPLEKIANLPGLVITALREGGFGPELFQGLNLGFDLMGRAVLVRTDWSKRWGGDYFRSGPFLTAETCRYLVEQKVALVGIDCANIDNMSDTSRPAHTLLLEAGIPIVEHLCNLEDLGQTNFRFFAVPPAIRGGTSFPIRAFALLEA